MNSRKDIVIPDIQSTADDRQIAIDKVGIKSIRYPVSIAELGGGVQKTVANFDMYVGLPKDKKGTHMSRFVEILNQPLIFIRQEDQSIRVFYNVCSHRGGSIKKEHKCVNYLQCSYHGWIYNLNGELKKSRGFNSSQLNFNDLKSTQIKNLFFNIFLPMLLIKKFGIFI